MPFSRRYPSWLLLFLLAAAPVAQGAAKPTLAEVGNQVYCLCGCVTTLNHCPHLPSECASRAEMQTLILNDIQQGKEDKAVLADLTGRFGVRVLASPPAKGFDLAVWILPGIGFIIGLAVVLTVVRRWRRKPPGPPQNSPIDAQAMAAVEEEMSRIDSLNH
ncbi:MAG: cytochrome c-type biogenesis protein [Terriglobia bacterium]